MRGEDYSPLQHLSGNLQRLELLNIKDALPAVLPQLTRLEALVIDNAEDIDNPEVLSASLVALTRLKCLEVSGLIDAAPPAELSALSRLQRLARTADHANANAQLAPVPGGAWLRSVVSLCLPAPVLACSLHQLAMACHLAELEIFRIRRSSKAVHARAVLNWAAQHDSLRKLRLCDSWARVLAPAVAAVQHNRPALSITFEELL